MILNGKNLIAQAKNGAGKTGALTIGSVLRVDPSVSGTQIIAIGNTRELVNQIHSNYEKIVRGTKITLQNLNYDQQGEPAHIIVTTLGKIEQLTKGRKPLNLKWLKTIVIDEADVFFIDDKNFN